MGEARLAHKLGATGPPVSGLTLILVVQQQVYGLSAGGCLALIEPVSDVASALVRSRALALPIRPTANWQASPGRDRFPDQAEGASFNPEAVKPQTEKHMQFRTQEGIAVDVR